MAAERLRPVNCADCFLHPDAAGCLGKLRQWSLTGSVVQGARGPSGHGEGRVCAEVQKRDKEPAEELYRAASTGEGAASRAPVRRLRSVRRAVGSSLCFEQGWAWFSAHFQNYSWKGS